MPSLIGFPTSTADAGQGRGLRASPDKDEKAMIGTASRRPHLVVDLLVLLVRAYQRLISPLFPASCRYVPSCSEYAAQALRRHGIARGLWLSACRVVRCNPWSQGGDDPVPARRD
jgi:putative membrane protein insertion efficiency factor